MQPNTPNDEAVTTPEEQADDAKADDRRRRTIPVAVDRRAKNAAEKRRTSERRRLIDPTTCERDYNDEETFFMKAMERYKRENRRPFPTWSEVLEVLRSLGYRKVADETALPGKSSNGVPAPAPAASTAESPEGEDRRTRHIPVASDKRAQPGDAPPKG